jgi:hypothetical protein
MRIIGENLRAASLGNVGSDQQKMQLALAAAESIAPDEEDSGFQDEGKEAFDGFGLGHLILIFWRMPVFVPLPVFARIENDKDKYKKTQRQQDDYAGLVLPNLLNAIRKLGPIHAEAT